MGFCWIGTQQAWQAPRSWLYLKTLPDFNWVIWAKYQQLPLIDAVAMLHDSHHRIQSLIERHTDEELFEKKRFTWTGSTSLEAYLIFGTSSH